MAIRNMPVKTKTGTPVTLEEAKKQVQIEPGFTNDDTFIQGLIEAALDKVEQDTNSDVLETLNVLTFKAGMATGKGQIYTFYQAPFMEEVKLEKRVGNIWSDVPEDDYQVAAGWGQFELELLEGIEADQLRFTYKTGYKDVDIPKVLKQAVLLKVSDMMDNERQGFRPMTVMGHGAYAGLIGKHVRTYWG